MSTMIQTEEQATKARTRLAEIDAQLAGVTTKREGLARRLGGLLAAIELGDKKAKAESGQVSMQLSGVTNDRETLASTRDALAEALAAWEETGQARRCHQALADLAAAEQEAKRLELLLADQVAAAVETGKLMEANGKRWTEARIAAGHAGGDTSAYPDAPQGAGALLDPGVLDRPAFVLGKFRHFRADRALRREREANPTPPTLLVYEPPPQPIMTVDDEMLDRIRVSRTRGAA